MTKKEIAEIISSRYDNDLLLALEYEEKVVEALKGDPQLKEELIAGEIQRRGYSIEPAEGELFIGDYEYRMKMMHDNIAALRSLVEAKLSNSRE